MSLNRFFRGASAFVGAGLLNQSATMFLTMSTTLLNASSSAAFEESGNTSMVSNSTNFDNTTICGASSNAAECSSAEWVIPSIAIVVAAFLIIGVRSRCGKSNLLWRAGEESESSYTEQSPLKQVLVEAPQQEQVASARLC